MNKFTNQEIANEIIKLKLPLKTAKQRRNAKIFAIDNLNQNFELKEIDD